MKTAADKSQYKRLYLIQPEIYNRVLPKLNEVEKQEQKDLQKKIALLKKMTKLLKKKMRNKRMTMLKK